MLVESDPHETRIAVLEDDKLTEVYIERRHHRGVVGNVYKGRVTRVLPGMQAAFVDIGLDRDAFLYIDDVVDGVHNGEELELGEAMMRAAAENSNGAQELPPGDLEPASPAPQESEEPAVAPTIDALLKAGQEILVQVTKDPLPNKGARVTAHVTLPGRFLVHLPTVDHRGVSRRIENEEERQRLRELIEQMADGGRGWIVRTAGEGREGADFEADRDYLAKLWARLHDKAERASAPSLVHRDLDLALRIVRDLFSADFAVLWVEGEDAYTRIVEFLDQVQPTLVHRVKLELGDRRLFDRFGVDREIEAALKPKVWLKSGGYLVINPTEALVAIDVNTGRYVGQHNLEETALATNLEAVGEAVRQIRLRDLGGIIVLDLIDMVEVEHRASVFAALEAELKKDRAKYKVLSISEFGLVEITRKRSRSNLERLLTQTCPYCEGSGRVRSIATTCLAMRRTALALRGTIASKELLVRAHPDVVHALQGEERAVVEEIERELGVALLVQGDTELHHSRFDILEV